MRPAEARRDLILLALGAAILFAAALGARDLWNPNEPTYGQAVVEMSDRGDWLVPSVNGVVFAEKPILYFWLARLAALLSGGVDEAALRMPSALSGLVIVVVLYLFVVPYAGRRRARLAAALVGTTYIVFWSARQVQMDLLLAACVLVAIFAVTRVVDHDWPPRRGWAVAGAAVGAGVLAKGPVGVLLPALVVVVYLVATRRPGRIFDRALLWGVAAFVAVAAPWFGALVVRGETEFLVELLWRQNFERFANPWDHQAPFWYYGVHFWLDMAPWGLFVPLAWGLAPADERERRLQRLAWVWIFAVVLFFSFSASKRSPYILPVAPAVAILVAGLAERAFAGRLDPLRRRIVLGLHGAIAAALIGAVVLLRGRLMEDLAGRPALIDAAQWALAVVFAGGVAVALGVVLAARRPRAAPFALFGFVVAVELLAAVHVLPALDARKSHRAFCVALGEHVGADERVEGYRLWKWRASYSFYSGRKIRSIDSAAALERYWEVDERVYVVVERGRLDEFRAIVGPVEPLLDHTVGSNRVLLFANRGAAARSATTARRGAPPAR